MKRIAKNRSKRNKQHTKSKRKTPKLSKAHAAKITRIDSQVKSVFDKINLLEVAKSTKYFIRNSAITPLVFVFALSFELFGSNTSLDLLAIKINTIFGIDVTAQAFCERMKQKKSVQFLKSCFEKLFKIQINESFSNAYKTCFYMFSEVILEDSTTIVLDEKVKGFKGAGGAGSKSALKLNWVYNLFSCSTAGVDILDGKTPDQKTAQKNLKLLKKKPGILLIRDMGYFAIASLRKINEYSCFYISRLVKGIKMFVNFNDEYPVNIEEFFKYHTRRGKSAKVLVYIGEEKFPTWLVIQKVPKRVLNRRIKRYKQKNSYRNPSEEYIKWAKYSVFITNIPDDLLENASCCIKQLIVAIYGLRWQIELLFKNLKSTIKIHFNRGKSPNRVLCLLYGRLITTMMALMVLSFASAQNHNGRELSPFKVAEWLVSGQRLVKYIMCGKFGQIFFECIKYFKLLSKDKRSRKTSLEGLEDMLIGFMVAA